MAKTGRPPSFKNEYIQQATKLCLLGATDKEMAGFFAVAEATFNNWKKQYPEFMESLKRGKEIADANVASKLYNRAIGYTCTEVQNTTKGGVLVESKEILKHIPSDTTAAIFWLKNRQSTKWRDKQNVEIAGNNLSAKIVVETINSDTPLASNESEVSV